MDNTPHGETTFVLYDWISHGGNPLVLLNSPASRVTSELKLCPIKVQVAYGHYYPLHCTFQGHAWLKAKVMQWLEYEKGQLPPYDTSDPIASSPSVEPITKIPVVRRVRYRKLVFNRSNATFFILRKLNITSKVDIQRLGYSYVVHLLRRAFTVDMVVNFHCGGNIPLGSTHRLIQQNVQDIGGGDLNRSGT